MTICDIGYYTQRLQCSDEEKHACLETVRALIQGAFMVRQEGILILHLLREIRENPEDPGLLSLSRRLPELGALMRHMDDPFFLDCLEYLVDGAEEDALRQHGLILLAAGNYQGQTFLKNILVLDGFCALLQGVSPTALLHTLFRWFGAGWRQAVWELIDGEWKRLAKKVVK